MATWVTEPLVQQWLEQTKLTVGSVPDELDQTAHDFVFGRVSQVYDVTTWVDTASTPSIILRIMSLLIAAWMYEIAYSEDLTVDANNYGVVLENRANLLLESIFSGAIDIIGVDPVLTGALGGPSFYPTDAQEEDGEGNEIKFAMGKTF